jgi:uncharacterized protein with HEPN domain
VPPTLADRVSHILEAIEEIERAMAGKSLEAFTSDRFLRLGVERLPEIVCEASRHIPDHVKAKETNIAWQKMTDFDNRLRHACHNVEATIVWNIIEDDLPPLKTFVAKVIRDESRRGAAPKQK